MVKEATILVCVVLVLFCAVGVFGGTYYVSPAGSDSSPGTEAQPWATVQKAANTLNAGDTVLIRNGTYPELVNITRSGAEGQPITFANYPGEEPVIDANGLSGASGIFVLQNCSHVEILGLRIFNATALHMSGIWTWNVNGLRIEDCYIYNTASSGIKVNYSYNVVITGSEIEKACDMGGEEDISIKLHSDGVVVSYNHIHHGMHEGIDVKEGAKNVQVIGNYIHRIERQGLYADSWNVPTYNIVYRDNIIHDCGFGLGACAEMGGLLSNVWFVNNLIYNCDGPGMFCKDWGGDTAHPIQNVYYINNTVYNCAWGWGAGMDIGNTEAENVVVRNNILSQCGQAIQVNREPVSKIIEYNLCEDTTGLDPAWAIEGLPMFVDGAGGDFHLQGGSDAIDAGSDANAPTVDLDGDPRPMGYGFDIGAYEWPLGDIDGDGHINFVDFAILGNEWGQTGGGLSADIAPLGGDGVVDEPDLAELVVCWPK